MANTRPINQYAAFLKNAEQPVKPAISQDTEIRANPEGCQTVAGG